MSIPAGWAEFNDANAIIRGRMVAMDGEFSGVFASDNIDAVKGINIRGGAVSTYMSFDFGENSTDVSFTVPALGAPYLLDITLPVRVFQGNRDSGTPTISYYKNGTLIASETFSGFLPHSTDVFIYLTCARIIDDYNGQATSYRIKVVSGTRVGLTFPSGVVSVACRKR